MKKEKSSILWTFELLGFKPWVWKTEYLSLGPTNIKWEREEGMNLLFAVSNFRPVSCELKLRHTTGTGRKKQMQMSLLQSSRVAQALLKHNGNPLSSLNLLSYLGDFSIFHQNTPPIRTTSAVKRMPRGGYVCLSSFYREVGWKEGMEQAIHSLPILYHQLRDFGPNWKLNSFYVFIFAAG